MIGDCCVCLLIRPPERDDFKNFKSYIKNIESLVQKLKNGNYCFVVSYYPKDKEKEFRNWLGKDIGYMPQIGKDINSRVKNIFIQAFSRGYKFVVLIDSSADLKNDIVEESLCNLEECDAVIGENEKGSFYLIGFKNCTFSPDIFYNLDLNSDESYNQLLENLRRKDYTIKELPTLQTDVSVVNS
jgi:glycosyltransferase A (GT-A) superfamily protein (DUF2064 family)